MSDALVEKQNNNLSNFRMNVVFNDPRIDEEMFPDFSSTSSFSVYLGLEGSTKPIWITLKYSRMKPNEDGTDSEYFKHDMLNIVFYLDKLAGGLGEGDYDILTIFHRSQTVEEFMNEIEEIHPDAHKLLKGIVDIIRTGINWENRDLRSGMNIDLPQIEE